MKFLQLWDWPFAASFTFIERFPRTQIGVGQIRVLKLKSFSRPRVVKRGILALKRVARRTRLEEGAETSLFFFFFLEIESGLTTIYNEMNGFWFSYTHVGFRFHFNCEVVCKQLVSWSSSFQLSKWSRFTNVHDTLLDGPFLSQRNRQSDAEHGKFEPF